MWVLLFNPFSGPFSSSFTIVIMYAYRWLKKINISTHIIIRSSRRQTWTNICRYNIFCSVDHLSSVGVFLNLFKELAAFHSTYFLLTTQLSPKKIFWCDFYTNIFNILADDGPQGIWKVKVAEIIGVASFRLLCTKQFCENFVLNRQNAIRVHIL